MAEFESKPSSSNPNSAKTYVGILVTADFLLVPPPPSSIIIRSASAISAPISSKPSISNDEAVSPPPLPPPNCDSLVYNGPAARDSGMDYLPQIIPRTLTLVAVALITDIFVPIQTSVS